GRICIRRGRALAERSSLPALRRLRSHFEDERQKHSPWPLQVLPMPQAIYRAHGDHFRIVAYALASLASSDALGLLVQEGDQRQSTSPDLGRDPQDRLVRGPSYP